MTPKENRLIIESYARLHEQEVAVALLFYGRLFSLDPSLKPLFHNDIREQSRKLMEMLKTLIDSLSEFEAMRPVLRELGRKHVEYGAKPQHYDTLGAALLWALGHALENHFTPEVRTAWAELIGTIATEMKLGAA